MPCLAVANEKQTASILDESHAVWGSSLSRRAYAGLWDELQGSPWGRKHISFLVWSDSSDRVLSSLKLYRPRVRLGTESGRAAVLAAIYTPRRSRGRGYATVMLRHVLDQLRAERVPAVLLFSDIGTEYYEKLGFRALRAEEQWGRLSRRPECPEGLVPRPAVAADLAAIRSAHEDGSRHRHVAILRDAEHWGFLATRTKSYFERLDDPGIHQSTWIVERRGRFSGYWISVEGRGEWNVREVGAVDGDPDQAAAVLRVGAATARHSGLRRIYGWLPDEVVSRLEDWRLRCQPRRSAVPMICVLQPTLGSAIPDGRGRAFIPFLDQF